MTPKEKAFELFKSFLNIGDLNPEDAKQCATIAVDEIIQLHKGKFMCEREEQNEEYWQQVKQEIQSL